MPAEITKSGQPRRLRIPEEFARYILDYIERRKIAPNDPLVRNGVWVTRGVSTWLRNLGWNGSKTNHALRKYFGYLVAKQHGMEVAQFALDHADIETTQELLRRLDHLGGGSVRLPKMRETSTNERESPAKS